MTAEREPVAGPCALGAEGDDRPLCAFLDRYFDGVPGVGDEFPLLVGPGNRARRLALRAGGALVAHAAWRPFVLRSPLGPIAAAGIGLVTTHPDWRERGLASRLVQSCLEQARAGGCELALLFGHTRGLYRRLGFVPAGRERITRLSATPADEASKIRPGGPADATALLPLLQAHPIGVERTLSEFRALLAIPGVALWCLEEEDRIRAYCVEGKGRDLVGVIHEWGGAPEAVRRLVASVVGRCDDVRFALSPEILPPPAPGEHSIGALAQLQILAPARFGSDDPRQVFGDPATAASTPIYLWGLDSL